ncbi:MAG: DUF58 domain-containing protein [Lachnospiraceae bacterium]|nr:DUF58 domain-containing protein [Lachnospiraceae bacterium]
MDKKNLFNIPYILTYILGILLILSAAVFYRQPLLSVLFITLIVMIPLSLLLLEVFSKRLRVDVRFAGNECVLPCEARIEINVRNPVLFPLLNCVLVYELENLFLPCDTVKELCFAAEARCDKKITVPVALSMPGMLVLRTRCIYITDLFHLRTKKIMMEKRIELPVYPADTPIDIPVLKKSLAGDEDVEWSHEGEYTRDLKQLREYRDGDRIKDIHWKITAKKGELTVKEYEKARELYYLVLPKIQRDDLKETLEALYAFSKYLIDQKEIFKCGIRNADTGLNEFFRINNEDDLNTMMIRIFRMSIPQTAADEDVTGSGEGGALHVIRISGHSIKAD